ncbi:MAG: DUF3488 domain-containing protein [Alphaproteobacteria bacterium CG_4_10_14_0_2_um_filter_63_37]|nr:MAG: hypothetical protein AUJ55_09315 [Proteobacteria bacterium CG1_02_64_396]PJA23832.1 MAG: DUF3488 domain-containing protein [Alphaproteobacteria bacterium CG_4_10_14_0_2_um_filter_63_37]
MSAQPTTGQPLDGARMGLIALALTLAAAPHFARIPIAATLAFLALLGWRFWFATHHRPLPNRHWISLLGGIALLLIWGGVGIGGLTGGVALLLVMIALRLMESPHREESHLPLFLGLFLVSLQFLKSQSLPTFALMAVQLLTLLIAWLALERSDPLDLRPMLRQGLTLMGQALPLALILFLLFPRLSGPLWGVPSSSSASSGLSEEVAPGDVSTLALSDAIAFRVAFDGAKPPGNQLYFRTIVLDQTDGVTWRALPPKLAPQTTGVEQGISQTITLEPDNQRWLPGLDRAVASGDANLDPHETLWLRRPLSERLRYNVTSRLDPKPTPLDAEQRSASLALPPPDPQVSALAASWRRQHPDDDHGVVQAGLDWLRSQPFVYTLNPPIMIEDPVRQFLFEQKRGFCEHFATAFAVLMRSAGIPARLVVGYQGGEFNPLGNYLIVRQRDAHAWVEVWTKNSGWERVDPTATVSPERIELGMGALGDLDALAGLDPAERMAALRDALAGGLGERLIENLRLGWDSLNNGWNQWVIGFGPELQASLLRKVGWLGETWQGLAVGMGVGVALFLGWFSLLHLRRPGLDPVVAAFAKVEQRLAKLGIQRLPGEGVETFCRRVEPWVVVQSGGLVPLALQYQRLRFAPDPHPDEMKAFQQRCRALRINGLQEPTT